jgi:hypothetical protein
MVAAACIAGMFAIGLSAFVKLADDVATGVFAAVGAAGIVVFAVLFVVLGRRLRRSH